MRVKTNDFQRKKLNPPHGEDCEFLLVNEDLSLEWADYQGNGTGGWFSIADLLSED